MSKLENVKDWFKNLVLDFREKINILNEDIKKHIDFLSNLTPPLQINDFWFHNSAFNIDLHIILFTKWKEVEDMKINIYGPIEFSKCVEGMEEILRDEKWNRIFPSKGVYWAPETNLKYTDTIGNLFYNVFNNFKREFSYWLFRENNLPSYISSQYLQTLECFTWICPGDITQLDYRKNVHNIIKQSKDKAKSKPANKSQVKPEYIDGYGTYFFPSIWLDGKPTLSLKDRILGSRLCIKKYDSLILNYKGRNLIIEKDGFIGIGEEDKDTALILLNEIMAVSILYNYNFHYIRENEIGPLSINPNTLSFQSTQLQGPNKRTDLSDHRWTDLTDIKVIYRTEIPKEDLIEIVRNAEELLISDDFSNSIILLLGATTHFHNREFSMSCLMSWALIEKKIVAEYHSIIKKQIDKKKQVDKLRNGKFKTIDDKLEILRIIGNLVNEEYEKYMCLKNLRNKIIHKGVRATESEAKKFLDLSIEIVKEVIKFQKKIGK
ncbi:hypothetical protein LCGC14_0668160 [marine sediment metagenome]|uniref:Uncharacterized protein n=1 Tax=marine sediment metagenome TaxID=412755 RepID=A0A0F9TD59_9ZZZZ